MANRFGARLAISRFQLLYTSYAFSPRTLPWAITFRALGAGDSAFDADTSLLGQPAERYVVREAAG